MAPLVSVIIPCYNDGCWVREAVESALAQTYKPVEVIVINDGSTDDSIEVLQSFGRSIILETGPNRGGNVARNRGISIAKGDYIQFLDSDDYILPQKLAEQVAYLESTKKDIVFGDWRYQFHEAGGSVQMGKVNVGSDLADPLEALLEGWFVPPNTYLFRSKPVMTGGGWDESLKRAQDTDFMISLAQTGVSFGYHPGCVAIYRSYKDPFVIWSGDPWSEHFKVMKKAEMSLLSKGMMNSRYRSAMARSYFFRAKGYYNRDRQRYWEFIAEGLRLDPHATPHGSLLYQLAVKFFGFGCAETIASLKHRFITRPRE